LHPQQQQQEQQVPGTLAVQLPLELQLRSCLCVHRLQPRLRSLQPHLLQQAAPRSQVRVLLLLLLLLLPVILASTRCLYQPTHGPS
jgi:hypothetical protein